MEQILAKAQALAARKELLDAERQTVKLEKEYNDIKLQLSAVLGEDALEIIEGGQMYVTDSGQTAYLQNGDWLFNNGGWYEKPTCNLHNSKAQRHGWSADWSSFSDLATFGNAVKKQMDQLLLQEKQKEAEAERAEAYYNANPDTYAISLFKRLILDLDGWDGKRHVNSGQLLLVALADYLGNHEQIPEWEDPDSDPDESEDNE